VIAPELLSGLVERVRAVREGEKESKRGVLEGEQLDWAMAERDALLAVASRAQRLGRSLACRTLL
jgi:hypothetical protein